MELQRTASNRSGGGDRIISSSHITVRSMDHYSEFFRQTTNRQEGWLEVLFVQRTNVWEKRWVVFEVVANEQTLILSKFSSDDIGSSILDRLAISMDDVVSFRTDQTHGTECITMKTTTTKLVLKAESKEKMQNWLFTFQLSVAFVLSHLLESSKGKNAGGALGGFKSSAINRGLNQSDKSFLPTNFQSIQTPGPNPFTRQRTFDTHSDQRKDSIQPSLGMSPLSGGGVGNSFSGRGIDSLGKGLPGQIKGDPRFAIDHGKHTELEKRRNSLKGMDREGLIPTSPPDSSSSSFISPPSPPSNNYQSPSNSSKSTSPLYGLGSGKWGVGGGGGGGGGLTRVPSLLSTSLQSGPSFLSQNLAGGGGGIGRGLGGGALTRTTAIDSPSPSQNNPFSFSSNGSFTPPSHTTSIGRGGGGGGIGSSLLSNPVSISNQPQNQTSPLATLPHSSFGGGGSGGRGLGYSSSEKVHGTPSLNNSNLSISLGKSPAIAIAFLNSHSPPTVKVSGSYQAEVPPPPIRFSTEKFEISTSDSDDGEEEEDHGGEGEDGEDHDSMLGETGEDGDGTWRDCVDYSEESEELDSSKSGIKSPNKLHDSLISNNNNIKSGEDLPFQLEEAVPETENRKTTDKEEPKKTRRKSRNSLSSPLSSPLSFASSGKYGTISWLCGSCSRLGPRTSNEDRFVCLQDFQASMGPLGLAASEVVGSPGGAGDTSTGSRLSFGGHGNGRPSSSSLRSKGPRSPSSQLAQSPPGPEAFFGVYDGHCGVEASTYLQKNLHLSIATHPSYTTNLEKAISESCLKTDQDFLELIRRDSKYAGSTAIGAIIRDGKLTVFNIGDCHAVIYLEGEVLEGEGESTPVPPESSSLSRDAIAEETGDEDVAEPNSLLNPPLFSPHGGRVIEMSVPHKPGREDERRRISQAHGWITEEKELYMGRLHIMDLSDPVIRNRAQQVNWVVIHRVCGELAISRSIGDPDYKGFVPGEKTDSFFVWPDNHDQTFMADLVVPIPEFKSLPLTSSLRFLLMGSDGLWDVLSPQEAVQVARSALARGLSPDAAAAHVCDLALRLGSADNVTAVLVTFSSSDD